MLGSNLDAAGRGWCAFPVPKRRRGTSLTDHAGDLGGRKEGRKAARKGKEEQRKESSAPFQLPGEQIKANFRPIFGRGCTRVSPILSRPRFTPSSGGSWPCLPPPSLHNPTPPRLLAEAGSGVMYPCSAPAVHV